MSDVFYPTVNLFLYDLRDGLGEENEDLKQRQEAFASRLPKGNRPLLQQRDREVEGVEYEELLGSRGKVRFEQVSQEYLLKGYYYPVRLGDSYALLLDCSVEHRLGDAERGRIEACPVSAFTILKAELETRLAGQASTIGQVWMLSAQIAEFAPDRAEEVAREICRQVPELQLDWDLHYQGQDHFLGGMLFEFWHYRQMPLSSLHAGKGSVREIHQLQENHCAMIALYPDRGSARVASTFDFDWLRLFFYRSKILWSYGQSRYLKKKLAEDFIAVQKYIEAFNQVNQRHRLNLKYLQQILIESQKTLTSYAIHLRYMSMLLQTMETNLLNYRRRLDRIQSRPIEFGSLNQIDCLKKFGDLVQDRYCLQVKSDYESLSPGLMLSQDLIAAIRGVAEIDQAKRDRTFQNTLAIVGLGLAAAALTATIAGQFPGANDPSEAAKFAVGSMLHLVGVPDVWLIAAVSMVWSIGSGVVVALATALMIQLKNWLSR